MNSELSHGEANQNEGVDYAALAHEAQSGQKTEQEKNGEWQSLIILQRHSKYANGEPADWLNPTDEERETLGHLTPEGKVMAAERAKARVTKALNEGGDNVDFLVVTSPTHWMGHEQLGKRADDTGKVISETILGELTDRGADSARLLNLSDRIDGKLTREHKEIDEARFFASEEFRMFMRTTYGGQNRDFWDAINRDTHQELRESLGAEGPQDVADRAQKTLDVIARFASYYETRHPGRKLVTFVVSHSEVVEPYVQRKLNVPEGEFEPEYNDGIEITFDKAGTATANVNGKEYTAPFRARS
jgi:hypothetical protein